MVPGHGSDPDCIYLTLGLDLFGLTILLTSSSGYTVQLEGGGGCMHIPIDQGK